MTDEEKSKCQYIYRNLLSMFDDAKNNSTSSIFIRELLDETSRCDKFSNLKDLRDAYRQKLIAINNGDDSIIDRIRNVTTVTDDDERLAIVVVNHYNEWTQERLLSCLTRMNWVKYQIAKKYDTAAALIGRR